MGTRAIGIVRVSQTKGREGESFHSPATQRQRIVDECERLNLELLEVHEELDISGGKPLAQRPGLLRAVEAIEAGDADVVIAAYLDRLARSVRVREDVIERVEACGGSVLTVDMGLQTNGTASQWLTGTLSSAVGEYLRRTTAERSALAQQRSIDRGVAPWPNVPPGYVREIIGRRRNGSVISGRLLPDPSTAPAVVEAFRMRLAGATLNEIRAHLAKHGIPRSYHGVAAMLASRVYLGEVNFGDYAPNLTAHQPVVDFDLWEGVQRVEIPRGRRPKSDRLLARLGVLRCGTCDARMVVGISRSTYPFYRCPPNGDCPRRVTISARIAEEFVSAQTRATLADLEGHASVEDNAREAEAELDRARTALDGAIRSLVGLEEEQATRLRLAELREVRDRAAERVEHLGGHRAVVVLNASADWGRLTLQSQRALIQATIARAVVAPGRGPDRITVETFGE